MTTYPNYQHPDHAFQKHRLNKSLIFSTLAMIFLLAGMSDVSAQSQSLEITEGNTQVTRFSSGEAQATIDKRSYTSSNPNVAKVIREQGTNDVVIEGYRPGAATVTFRKSLDNGRTWKTMKVHVTVVARKHKSIFDPPNTNGGNSGNQSSVGGGNNGAGDQGPIHGAIRPIEVRSKAPEEPPTLLNLGNRGYHAVYKNKFGEVVQVKEYDKTGRLIRTREIDMYFPNGKPASVSYEKPNGDLEEITYDPAGTEITKAVYTDLTADGYMKKEVLENGVMKKYYKDARGKWQPVANGNQAGNANQPINPNADKPPNKGAPQAGFGCLAGTWRSVSVSRGFYTSGGGGILLNIMAAGQAIVYFDTMDELKADSPTGVIGTQKFSGVGNARIKVVGQKISVTPTGNASIMIRSSGRGGMTAGPFSGLGPLAGMDSTVKFTCAGDSLILEPFEVDKFTFAREK